MPGERFRLAAEDPAGPEPPGPAQLSQASEASTTRKVSVAGKISFASQLYAVGVWLAGETVEVSVAAGLVSMSHRGVLVATNA